jgi:hypothetical protein
MVSYIKNMVTRWWKTFNMSAEEHYLSQSKDIVDFEGRLKRIMFDKHTHNNLRGT